MLIVWGILKCNFWVVNRRTKVEEGFHEYLTVSTTVYWIKANYPTVDWKNTSDNQESFPSSEILLLITRIKDN